MEQIKVHPNVQKDPKNLLCELVRGMGVDKCNDGSRGTVNPANGLTKLCKQKLG